MGNFELIWNLLGDARHYERVNVQLVLREEKAAHYLECCPTCTCVVVWRERKRRAFEGVGMNLIHLRNSVSLISFWCTPEVPFCIEVGCHS